jgi:hypothetical protein
MVLLTYSRRLRLPRCVCFAMKGVRMPLFLSTKEASNLMMDKCHQKNEGGADSEREVGE